jgi:hypothetical protein
MPIPVSRSTIPHLHVSSINILLFNVLLQSLGNILISRDRPAISARSLEPDSVGDPLNPLRPLPSLRSYQTAGRIELSELQYRLLGCPAKVGLRCTHRTTRFTLRMVSNVQYAMYMRHG